jgi:N-acetylmuramoyl-L-alanine amidase
LRTNQPIANEDTSGEDLEKQKQEWLVDTIVIDPGHGGKDPGAIGYGKLKEKDIVLPIGLKLGAALKKQLPDVNIIYTRDTDVFIPLWKRTKIANENNGKLFVSLHCNSNNSKSVNGFETYFLSADKDDKARDVVLLENESVKFESTVDQKRYEGVNFVLATLAQNAFLKYSQYFASLVQKSLKLNMQPEGMKDRGVKQGPFWVMVGATMPNILVEMGFISNKFESKLLKQKSIQTKIAESICNGIVKYKNDFENAL